MNSPGQLISTFTPSLMPPEVLEALFVKRQSVLDRLVAHTTTSVETAAKHFDLLVGPRGIGKTHLISLAYHRIKSSPLAPERYAIAWLKEEEWGIASFFDLLLRILRAIDRTGLAVSGDALDQRIDALADLPVSRKEQQALKLLSDSLGNKVLLLLAENLDMVFEGMGESGQKKLRGWLQESQRVAVIASAPTLFEAVQLQRSPFYGFFKIEHLEEFSLDEAGELLQKAARLRGRDDAAEFLATPTGRARLRALQHLAGGNPRVYMIFAQFLTRQSMDELVEPFMKTLDDLTPYYQAKMLSLSAQQRKIIEVMCDVQGGETVKGISRRAHASSQTISSQLAKLKDIRLVKTESLGKQNYYQLAEPLMRLCLDVKRQRSAPVRCLVEFLRIWYYPHELRMLADTGADGSIGQDLARAALKSHLEQTNDPKLAALNDEFASKLSPSISVTEMIAFAEAYAAAEGEGTSFSIRLLVDSLVFLPKSKEVERDLQVLFEQCQKWLASTTPKLDSNQAIFPCRAILLFAQAGRHEIALQALAILKMAYKSGLVVVWTEYLMCGLRADVAGSEKLLASISSLIEIEQDSVEKLLHSEADLTAGTLCFMSGVFFSIQQKAIVVHAVKKWAAKHQKWPVVAVSIILSAAATSKLPSSLQDDFRSRWLSDGTTHPSMAIAARIYDALHALQQNAKSPIWLQLKAEERGIVESITTATLDTKDNLTSVWRELVKTLSLEN